MSVIYKFIHELYMDYNKIKHINKLLIHFKRLIPCMLVSQHASLLIMLIGGGPRVVVSIAAFHARVRGSVPGLGGFKETKMFLPHPRVKVSIVGSLHDREVACSASDRQGSNFESCVWSVISIISPASGGSPGPV